MLREALLVVSALAGAHGEQNAEVYLVFEPLIELEST